MDVSAERGSEPLLPVVALFLGHKEAGGGRGTEATIRRFSLREEDGSGDCHSALAGRAHGGIYAGPMTRERSHNLSSRDRGFKLVTPGIKGIFFGVGSLSVGFHVADFNGVWFID